MQRKTAIVRIVEICQVLIFLRSPNEDGMTAYQIAAWIGIKPSGHMCRLLNKAVSAGFITYTYEQHRPTVRKKRYTPTSRGIKLAHDHHAAHMFENYKPEDRPLKVGVAHADNSWR